MSIEVQVTTVNSEADTRLLGSARIYYVIVFQNEGLAHEAAMNIMREGLITKETGSVTEYFPPSAILSVLVNTDAEERGVSQDGDTFEPPCWVGEFDDDDDYDADDEHWATPMSNVRGY